MPRAEPPYFSTQVRSARRFYLPVGKIPADLAVVGAGREECRPDYLVHRKSFPHLALEYVARGEGALRLGRTTWKLQAGVAYVYDRKFEHRIQATTNEGISKYFVLMHGTAVRTLLRRYRLSPGTVVQLTSPEKVGEILEDLVEHGLGDHRLRSEACAVTLGYLLMKIGDLAVPYGQLAGASFSTYQRCRRHMEQNFFRLTAVRQVAEECHIDTAYMCRLFKRFGRQSPYQYLQHLRLNHAVDLLQNSFLSAKEVASKMGFNDAATFSRSVRRTFGIPPSRLLRPEEPPS